MLLDRRVFLALAAGSGARALQPPPLGIGFLGASHSHAAGKLAALRRIPDWRLVGICEPAPALQQKLRAQGIAILSREELLHHPGVRAIAVESAVRDHARDGLAVLEAGKHLHLEKAPSDNMADFQKLVELAARNRLLLQVGYMWRHNPAIVKALEAARQGWLGTVYQVRAHIGNQLEAARRPEWGQFAGGVMFELGCHVIDPVVRLLGRPRSVTPYLRTSGDFGDRFRDNTLAVLQWDRAVAAIEAVTLEPHSSRYRALEICGANGRALVNPIEPPALTIDLQKAAGPYAAGAQKVAVPEYARYIDDLRELAAAVRGETGLCVTPEEDLMVEETVLRASGMFPGQRSNA